MKLIISNLKMNKTLPEIIQYEQELSKINSIHRIIVCPSYPFLSYFTSSNYDIGSQNVSELENGSLTGEVSAEQLKSLNVKYSIVGHSERKRLLSETNKQSVKKIKNLIKNNIKPILCVGETEPSIINNQVIEKELIEILEEVDVINDLIIAYEPVWAIGTGKIPTVEKIRKTVIYIKKFIADRYNSDIKVIYGGSVNLANIELLNTIKELDGYLLGEASLDINKLKQIIEKMEVV